MLQTQLNPTLNDNKTPVFWLDKPYYSLNAFCQNTFHEKLYKIAIDAGFTCPNRDGTLGERGCIFCSAGGSGDFAVSAQTLSMREQIQQGLSLFHSKQTGTRFIAYFQAYTNTYAPAAHLKKLFSEALAYPQIAGISIATRPDCVSAETIQVLAELRSQYPDKFIWVELGLQTIHEKTAAYIRRGYPLICFEQALAQLATIQIPVIVHVILGLPGETAPQMLETIQYLNSKSIWGIKLQLLHVLKNTDLALEYEKKKFAALEFENYVNLVIQCLEQLSPEIVVHRITGDGPKELLIAPLWSLNKRNVLNTIHHEMRIRNTYQGRNYYDSRSTHSL